MSYPPQGYGGGYGGYPQGPTPVVVQSNGLATGALVTGLISALCFPLLSLVAIPLGFAGLSKAKRLHGAGRGQAIGGLVAGFIGLIWIILLVVLLIAGAFASDDLLDDAVCSFDRIELETAVEAFQTGEQRDPTSQSELVSQGYLTDEVDTYDFSITNGTVDLTPVSGQGCT